MKINGVDFNQEWAQSQTEKQFIDEFINIHFQELPDRKRESHLKKAYALLTKKDESPKPEDTVVVY